MQLIYVRTHVSWATPASGSTQSTRTSDWQCISYMYVLARTSSQTVQRRFRGSLLKNLPSCVCGGMTFKWRGRDHRFGRDSPAFRITEPIRTLGCSQRELEDDVWSARTRSNALPTLSLLRPSSFLRHMCLNSRTRICSAASKVSLTRMLPAMLLAVMVLPCTTTSATIWPQGLTSLCTPWVQGERRYSSRSTTGAITSYFVRLGCFTNTCAPTPLLRISSLFSRESGCQSRACGSKSTPWRQSGSMLAISSLAILNDNDNDNDAATLLFDDCRWSQKPPTKSAKQRMIECSIANTDELIPLDIFIIWAHVWQRYRWPCHAKHWSMNPSLHPAHTQPTPSLHQAYVHTAYTQPTPSHTQLTPSRAFFDYGVWLPSRGGGRRGVTWHPFFGWLGRVRCWVARWVAHWLTVRGQSVVSIVKTVIFAK